MDDKMRMYDKGIVDATDSICEALDLLCNKGRFPRPALRPYMEELSSFISHVREGIEPLRKSDD